MSSERKFVLAIGIVALVLFVIDAQFHRTFLNAIGCGLLGAILIILGLLRKVNNEPPK